MNTTYRNIILIAAAVLLLIGALSLINVNPEKTLDMGTFIDDIQQG